MSADAGGRVPRLVDVAVQLRAGSFVKRRSDGTIDYLAPLPSPFSYGEVAGTRAADGDAIDVVVWAAWPRAGTTIRLGLRGAIDFVDAGVADPKLVCAARPLRPWERACVLAWFGAFARAKAVLAALRGVQGVTKVRGWLEADAAEALLDAAETATPRAPSRQG